MEYIWHVIRTVTGFYQKPFNKQWDEKLKWYLDGGEVIPKKNRSASEYFTTTIRKEGKSIEVWIGNKYYSYGHLWAWDSVLTLHRPSINTMLLLNDRCEGFIKLAKAEDKRQSDLGYEKL